MWNNTWNFESGDLYQIYTFNECHCTFLICHAQISYKTNTVDRTVQAKIIIFQNKMTRAMYTSQVIR